VRRDPTRHDVERNLALMAPFGGAPSAPVLHVPVRPDAADRAAHLVPPGDGPLVVMAPGSVWPTKRWTADGFADVARRLAAAGARVVLVGGPGDVEVATRVAALAGRGVTSHAGRTDLATSVALIDRAAVLVGNDSAPMHVACARGVPVVAVFCATTPALGYGPWGERTRVVDVDLACRPCGRHGGRRCPRGTEDCMRLVEPARVLDAVHAVWRTDVAA
jgi:heptosyltransferase-2